ncbi:hypothetical protein ACE1SV_59950 [Streptomyces sp. E-15]
MRGKHTRGSRRPAGPSPAPARRHPSARDASAGRTRARVRAGARSRVRDPRRAWEPRHGGREAPCGTARRPGPSPVLPPAQPSLTCTGVAPVMGSGAGAARPRGGSYGVRSAMIGFGEPAGRPTRPRERRG